MQLRSSPAPSLEAPRKGGLLVEALAAGNDSGLGRMTRLYLDVLSSLALPFPIHVILREATPYRAPVGLREIRVRARPYRIWRTLIFPLWIRRWTPQAVLCFGQTLPRFRPRVVYGLLVFDVGPLESLTFQASKYQVQNRTMLRRQLHRADSLITCSDFTAGRMAEILSCSHDRIQVWKPWFRRIEFVSGSRAATSDHVRMPALPDAPLEPFFLSVGNLEPRKNYPGLLLAYSLALKVVPNLPELHLVGHGAWGLEPIKEAIDRLELATKVHLRGHLPDGKLSQLYQSCSLYISPSLYEGWGLPLYEALLAGRACLYHEGTSQDEFARAFARATDASKPQQLAADIIELWQSADERAKLEEKARREFPSGELSELKLKMEQWALAACGNRRARVEKTATSR